MTEKRFQSSAQAKAAGWHSKRHETREAQDEARKAYHENRGPAARRRRAEERAR